MYSSKLRFGLKLGAGVIVAIASGFGIYLPTNATAATVKSATVCKTYIPVVIGQIWDCKFDSPSTVYFVSVGGKGYRFRWGMDCGSRHFSNLRPAGKSGDDYKLIRSNKRHPEQLGDLSAVKALHHASSTNRCKLHAEFLQKPGLPSYSARYSFVAKVANWRG